MTKNAIYTAEDVKNDILKTTLNVYRYFFANFFFLPIGQILFKSYWPLESLRGGGGNRDKSACLFREDVKKILPVNNYFASRSYPLPAPPLLTQPFFSDLGVTQSVLKSFKI